jgi:hypothetical protein
MLLGSASMRRRFCDVVTICDHILERSFVFPKACLARRMKTRNGIGRLYDYFDTLPNRLEPNEAERIARAVNGVAEMNSEFSPTAVETTALAAV